MVNKSLESYANLLKENRNNTNKKIGEVFKEINEKKNFDFDITDHAIIRYLQRVELIPPSEARHKILTILSSFLTKNNLTIKSLIEIMGKKSNTEITINSVSYLLYLSKKNNKPTVVTIKALE